MKWKSLSHVRLFAIPWTIQSMEFSSPEYSSILSLQRIFPTQESNLGLPHCRRFLYQLRHKGSPRILEWVAYPFFSGSYWPRNQTRVSCIAGGFKYKFYFSNKIWKIVANPSVLLCSFEVSKRVYIVSGITFIYILIWTQYFIFRERHRNPYILFDLILQMTTFTFWPLSLSHTVYINVIFLF